MAGLARAPVDRAAAPVRRSFAADAAVENLRREGIDMGRLRHGLGELMAYARPLPQDLVHALRRAGVDTHVPEGVTLVDHPLQQLQRALRRFMRSQATAGAVSAARPGPALQMPERYDEENHRDYAWRAHTLNPGHSMAEIVARFMPDRSRRDGIIHAASLCVATAARISSQFSRLRAITPAAAAGMGFKDAATATDDPTACLFGEDLSLSNPGQLVIGLAPVATDHAADYNHSDNKDLVFMDLNSLARHLVKRPVHPLNNEALSAENIQRYAFRIGT